MTSHQWNADGERCTVCGDKDWMGGPCSGSESASPEAAPAAMAQFVEPSWKDAPPDWCTAREEEIWQEGYDCAMGSCRAAAAAATPAAPSAATEWRGVANEWAHVATEAMQHIQHARNSSHVVRMTVDDLEASYRRCAGLHEDAALAQPAPEQFGSDVYRAWELLKAQRPEEAFGVLSSLVGHTPTIEVSAEARVTPESVWHQLAHAHKLLSRMDDPNAKEARHSLDSVAETLRIWNQRIVDVGVLAMLAASPKAAPVQEPINASWNREAGTSLNPLNTAPKANPMDPEVSALRWLLNITTEFDRKDVRTRQAARLLDDYSVGGKTNREHLESLWSKLALASREEAPAAPVQQDAPAPSMVGGYEQMEAIDSRIDKIGAPKK